MRNRMCDIYSKLISNSAEACHRRLFVFIVSFEKFTYCLRYCAYFEKKIQSISSMNKLNKLDK